MPGTWEDGDDDGDDPVATPPIHPDDRLWRHPSEVEWGSPGLPAGSTTTTAAGSRTTTRVWALALTSGLTGAALALGVVALVAGIGSGDSLGTAAAADRAAATAAAAAAGASSAITPTGVAGIAEAVMPSVVRVEVAAPGEEPVTGSGVVLLDDGHVVTNAHLLAGDGTVTIVLSDGTRVPAHLVGLDDLTDLAVVAPDEGADGLDRPAWVPAELGSTDDLAVGEPTVIVGSVMGAARVPSLALGVVSALGRRVATSSGEVLHDMIQTDVLIAPGSSGGALCDRTGAVVGLTTARVGTTEGLGFATPIEVAWTIAEMLIEDGAVHHVWLGIEGTDAASTQSSLIAASGGAGGGVFVDRVLPGTPAADSDLEPGDVVTAIDDDPVTSMNDLVAALRVYQPGDLATLEVRRGTTTRSVEVTLSERDG